MKIRQYSRQQVESPSTGQQLMPSGGVASMAQAEGFGQLGAAAAELARRSQEASRLTDVSLRTMGLRRAYGEWWVGRSADPTNYATLAADSDAVLTQLTEQALKGVDDQRAQAAILKDAFEFSTTQGIEARKTQMTQQIEWSRAALYEGLQQRRTEVSQVTDGVERNRLLHQGLSLVREAAATGIISPLDAAKQERAFIDGVAEDQLNLQVYQDPDNALAALYSGAYASLSEDTRQRLIINAEKRSEALRQQRASDERRAEVAERRAQEEVQDYTFGSMYQRVKVGAVTKADVYAALGSRQIRAEHFRTLWDSLEVMERAGGPGNAEASSRLKLRAWGGDLSVGELMQAATDDGLNDTELGELLDIVTEGSAIVNSQEYREALTYLEGQMGIAKGIDGIQGQQIVVASMARRELYQRARSDPRANPFDIATELAERYKTINISAGARVKPRYASPELAKGAFIRGEISSLDELNTELEIHNRQKAAP